MKNLLTLTLLAAVVLLGAGTGCVSQSQADAWQRKYRSVEETVLDLQQQLDERDDEIALLRGKTNPNEAMRAQIEALTAEADALRASLAQAQDALRNAGSSPLPTILVSQLEQLANANPDLMTFDPGTGMIRFRSDVTFALGSTTVSDQARNLLGQLAGVLNSPAAAGYEARVVGHTDNVPVTNPVNRKKYEDNWGLSAFRAIAVMRVLKSAGVSQERMSIGGYGQQKPIAPNGPKGAEANRRVEIYLVANAEAEAPAPQNTGTSTGGVVPMDTPPAPAESPAMFK